MTGLSVLGIGAWDRSGSTIVANVLGAVPGVVSVGELNNLWHRGVELNRICACGARFNQCPFWGPVMARAFPGPAGRRLLERAIEVPRRLGNAQLVVPPTRRSTEEARGVYGEALHSLYRAIAGVSGAQVIVDSAKTPWHMDIASRVDGAAFALLHLVRDPRGVAYSLLKSQAYDSDAGRPEEMDRHGSAFTALGWRYRNTLLRRFGGGRGGYLPVRYEDFVDDPQSVVDAVLEMFGLEPYDLPTTDGGAVLLPANHSVSGNPVRFGTGPTAIRLDEEWRTGLDGVGRLVVSALTWPMASGYGYR